MLCQFDLKSDAYLSWNELIVYPKLKYFEFAIIDSFGAEPAILCCGLGF